MIVTDGSSFFSEEKRDCKFEIVPVEPGVPAFRLVNTEVGGKYRIEKEIFADPHRNVVLQKIKFIELSSTGQPVVPRLGGSKFRLYALLAPHLGNVGSNNTAWTGDYKGVPMLYGGDELSHTQNGNNNGYCQDNELTWLNWELDEEQQSFLDFVRRVTLLWRTQPVFQRREPLTLDGFAGSGADFPAQFKPSILDGKTVILR